jgi:hypothetical protein
MVLRFIITIADVCMDIRRVGSQPAQIRIAAVERDPAAQESKDPA